MTQFCASATSAGVNVPGKCCEIWLRKLIRKTNFSIGIPGSSRKNYFAEILMCFLVCLNVWTHHAHLKLASLCPARTAFYCSVKSAVISGLCDCIFEARFCLYVQFLSSVILQFANEIGFAFEFDIDCTLLICHLPYLG